MASSLPWWMEGVPYDAGTYTATNQAMLEQYVLYLRGTRATVFRADPLEKPELAAMIGHAAAKNAKAAVNACSTLHAFASIEDIEQADVGAHMCDMIDQASDERWSNSRDAFAACIAACRGYLAGQMIRLADTVSANPSAETVWRTRADTKFCSPHTETIRQKLVKWDNAVSEKWTGAPPTDGLA